MAFILDASITMAWCFQDEATPASWSVMRLLQQETAHVPSVWPLEISNVLLMAAKRKRLSYEDAYSFASHLKTLPVQKDSQDTIPYIFDYIYPLAQEHALTPYDASYIELALRLKLPLATKDQQMIVAAKNLGLAVIGNE